MRDSQGRWVDTLEPAQRLSPARQAAVLAQMYQRCAADVCYARCLHMWLPDSDAATGKTTVATLMPQRSNDTLVPNARDLE